MHFPCCYNPSYNIGATLKYYFMLEFVFFTSFTYTQAWCWISFKVILFHVLCHFEILVTMIYGYLWSLFKLTLLFALYQFSLIILLYTTYRFIIAVCFLVTSIHWNTILIFVFIYHVPVLCFIACHVSVFTDTNRFLFCYMILCFFIFSRVLLYI